MNSTLIQVIAILMILFFFFLTYMCTKTWKAVHVTVTFLVFAATLTFTAYAALSLKTNSAWKQAHAEWVEKLAAVRAEGLQLEHGNLLERMQTTDSVRSLREANYRVILDRGRVWRKCQLKGPMDQNQSVTLTVAVPPAVGPDEQPPPVAPHQIKDNTVVYAFTEKEYITPQGVPAMVPDVYVGKYRVREGSTTDTDVTLDVMLTVDQFQIAAINDLNRTWTLYELMPADGHRMFAASEPTDSHTFGQVDTDFISGELMPNVRGIDDAKHREVIFEYVNDGRRRQDIEAENPTFQPDPGVLYTRVKFLEKWTEAVDSENSRGAMEDGYYDAFGLAVAERLKRGEEVTFNPDDEGIFDFEQAESMIALGTCERIEDIYVRKLHDYENDFHEFYNLSFELAEKYRISQRNVAELEPSSKRLEAAIAAGEAERAILEQDAARFQVEAKTVEAQEALLRRQWTLMTAKINQLYRENRVLAEQLAAMQTRLAQQIRSGAVQPAAPAATDSAGL